MRWLLCGGDGSEEKTTSVITEKYPARDFFHYRFKFIRKIESALNYSHYSFMLIRKIKSAPRQICNYFWSDGRLSNPKNQEPRGRKLLRGREVPWHHVILIGMTGAAGELAKQCHLNVSQQLVNEL